MIKSARLFATVPLMLILSVVLSACSAGQQVTAADVIQKMRDTMQATQTAQGTVDLALTINKEGLKTLLQGLVPQNAPTTSSKDWTAQLPDSVNATLNFWKQAPDKARVEVASSSLSGVKGDTLVYDGQKVYAYDVAHNTVYTGTPSKLIQKVPSELQGLLQGSDPQQMLDKVLSAADITLAGTEQVAGINAYKLDIKPKPEAASLLGIPQAYQMQAGVIIKDLRATLWVDQNRWIPLKMEVDHPNIGQFTYTATSLDLNKPIDTARFVLQVPAGARTVDLDNIQAMTGLPETKSITIQEARQQAAAAGIKLLEPTYTPGSATLVEVTEMQMSASASATAPSALAFKLSYSSPSGSDFSIIEGRMPVDGLWSSIMGTSPPGGSTVSGRQQVTVRGVQGSSYSAPDGSLSALSWQEKDGTRVIIAGKVPLSELSRIAEGLK